jgi:ketosteroid isomerase-like protein
MSEENIEIVRRVYEARGDPEAVLAYYDPDVEFNASQFPFGRLVGGAGIYRGHEGLRRFFREYYSAWSQIEDDYEELIDADESVISVVSARGRGRRSGVEVQSSSAAVWTIRDGKIVRVTWFATRAEALEAAGLSE